MIDSFQVQQLGPYQVWQYRPWLEQGFVHGCIGATGDFSDSKLAEERPRFLEAMSVDNLHLPQQVHGTTIVQFCGKDSPTGVEGDGILIKPTSLPSRVAFGVRTADCVPLILRGESHHALIHAGWRGLARGIIQKVFSQAFSPDTEVVIGPCAGSERYEVGHEVIDALGTHAISQPVGEKFLLDLSKTAQEILVSCGIHRSNIHILDICTISDTRFHSFRRQAAGRGSNVTFVVT